MSTLREVKGSINQMNPSDAVNEEFKEKQN